MMAATSGGGGLRATKALAGLASFAAEGRLADGTTSTSAARKRRSERVQWQGRPRVGLPEAQGRGERVDRLAARGEALAARDVGPEDELEPVELLRVQPLRAGARELQQRRQRRLQELAPPARELRRR